MHDSPVRKIITCKERAFSCSFKIFLFDIITMMRNNTLTYIS